MKRIAKETWIIAAIGIADLITTILFIHHHGAEEANPLFRRYWEMGLSAFIIAKLVMLACPLLVLEWARVRKPVFVKHALRFGIGAYLTLYVVGGFRMNTDASPVTPAEVARAYPGMMAPVTAPGALPSYPTTEQMYRTESFRKYMEQMRMRERKRGEKEGSKRIPMPTVAD